MALDVASEVERESAPAPPRSRFLSDLTTVPNLLSSSRVVLVLVAAALYLYGDRKVAVAVGVVAGLTDLLDGVAARKLGQVTELGAIIDRLSDLILEGVSLVVIVFYHLLSPAYLVAYLVREFAVLSGRLYVAGRGGDVPTSLFGKLKTDCFAGAFVGIFASQAGFFSPGRLSDALFSLGHVGIVAGLILSYVSGFQYLRAFASVYGAPRGHHDVDRGE